MYNIAVASSDGINVDLKFGEAQKFLIYGIDENIVLIDERSADTQKNEDACPSKCSEKKDGCSGSGGGCGGDEGISQRLDVISDCRCLLCKKAGFKVQKELEKRAITLFDIECPIDEALKKIANYYRLLDNNQKFSRI